MGTVMANVSNGLTHTVFYGFFDSIVHDSNIKLFLFSKRDKLIPEEVCQEPRGVLLPSGMVADPCIWMLRLVW